MRHGSNMCTIGGVFSGLGQEIEQLEVPADGEAIAQAIALYDCLGARITAAVAAFEATRVSVDAEGSMTS